MESTYGTEETPSSPTSSTDVQEEKVETKSGGWGNWFKEKSNFVLEAVKKDLDEISQAVKTEASNASSAISGSLQMSEPDSTVNYMKKSLSSFLGSVTEALSPTLDDDCTEAVMITNDDMLTLTGFSKHLAELQSNDKTYLEEPGDQQLAEQYKRWLEVMEQDQFTQNRIARMLASSQILAEKYEKFVPNDVTHMNFWKRYLFKKALLEDELANIERKHRQEAEAVIIENEIPIEEPSIQMTQPKRTVAEEVVEAAIAPVDELSWDGDFELSEEEQARLLAEYEQEIKDREKVEVSVKKPASSKVPANSRKTQKANTPAAKTQPPSKSTKEVPNKSNNKNKQKMEKPTNTAAKKTSAVDVSVKDELKMDKNHFNKDEASSSNSSDSWEKEFDLES